MLSAIAVGLVALSLVGAPEETTPVRVLVVTGGHGFERAPFFEVFDAMPGVTWVEAVQPEANNHYSEEASAAYDVIVLYDMVQEISEEQKEDLVHLLKDEGKSLVALHHSIANYQAWEEYPRIIGARYYLPDLSPEARDHGPSTWEHDQDMEVEIADPEHPITKGLENFPINDETYDHFDVLPGVTELLRVKHPKSAPVVAWAHTYGKANIAYIQLGHGPSAFSNENFRKVVRNAILWAARK